MHATCVRRAEDPEPIKLLKRKLQVALSEEDYRTAVSIRDHPYLDLHRKAHTARWVDGMCEGLRASCPALCFAFACAGLDMGRRRQVHMQGGPSCCHGRHCASLQCGQGLLSVKSRHLLGPGQGAG